MRDADALGDLTEIMEAIALIERYIAGLSEADFCASDKGVDATAMNLIVIGEAERRLQPALLTREPAIPWPRIVSVRNRIAHGYASVQRPVVWSIATRELPELRAAIEQLIAGVQPPP
jgi:uncharacterized protein with HEPN domain